MNDTGLERRDGQRYLVADGGGVEYLGLLSLHPLLHHCCAVVKTNTALGKEVQANTGLKLGDFKTMEDTARYVDAIVSSGSIEEARGSVYVLGNSESGKTSLCKTLREYCKNDNEAPAAILEERETRTKVLDFVKEVQLRQKARKTVTACKSTKSLLGTINYEKNKTATDDGGDEAVEGIKTTFVDFGGHSEYVSCSSVFLKEKGIFLICFPKSKFADADEATFEKTFFPSIGTYLELALEKCDEPMFFLVATKADEAEKSKNCQRIMDKAKAHLKAIADETKRPWIFDKVFETALYEGQADADLQDRLDDLRDMLVAIFRNKQLMDVKLMEMKVRGMKVMQMKVIEMVMEIKLMEMVMEMKLMQMKGTEMEVEEIKVMEMKMMEIKVVVIKVAEMVMEMKLMEMRVMEMKVMATATISLKVLGTPSCLQRKII